MKKTQYTPISCSYYDELEALATLAQQCSIIYSKDNHEIEVNAIIKDFRIINKVEFMLLDNGQFIRLDTLISVNAKALQFYC